MAKNISSDQNVTQTQLDTFEVPLTITTGKLDADQYSADDIDGVTESVFGSGNMAYASLQASQTDAAMRLNNKPVDADSSADNATNGFDNNASDPGADVFEDSSQQFGNSAGEQSYAARGSDVSAEPNSGGRVTTDGNFSGSTVGSAGASQLSSDAGAFAPSGSGLSISDIGNNTADGQSGQNGQDGQNGDSGQNGSNGNNGDNGNNGQNGEDTQHCNDHGDININPHIDIDILDLGNVSVIVNDVLVNLGDVITTLTDTVTNITNNLDKVLGSLDITNILDLGQIVYLLNTTGDTLTTTITETMNEITDITENITNVLDGLGGDALGDVLGTVLDSVALDDIGDVLGDLGGITQTLQGNIYHIKSGLLDLDLGEAAYGVKNVVNDLTQQLDVVTDITSGLADKVDGALGTIIDNLGFEGLGNNDGGADSDITTDLDLGVLNTDVGDLDVEAVLDPVEDIVGDLDVDLSGAVDLLGDSETSNAAGDTDLVVDTGIDIVDSAVADLGAVVELDVVEDIVGDIDLDLGVATDILGAVAGPVVNEGEGGSGEDTIFSDIGDVLSDTAGNVIESITEDSAAEEVLDDVAEHIDLDALVEAIDNDLDTDILDDFAVLGGNNGEASAEEEHARAEDTWTESTIGDVSSVLDDITGGLGDDSGILPDPAGTIAEGIGVLDIEPELDIGSLGGLFG